MEPSTNYARVLSLGFNASARAEVTYPPIIDPGDSYFGVGVNPNGREGVEITDVENYLAND